jgi:hypothetical protein
VIGIDEVGWIRARQMIWDIGTGGWESEVCLNCANEVCE